MELSKLQINIILIISSLIAGYYLNKLANNQANKQLLAQLEADIASINQQQHVKKMSIEEATVLEKRKLELQAQVNILSQQ